MAIWPFCFWNKRCLPQLHQICTVWVTATTWLLSTWKADTPSWRCVVVHTESEILVPKIYNEIFYIYIYFFGTKSSNLRTLHLKRISIWTRSHFKCSVATHGGYHVRQCRSVRWSLVQTPLVSKTEKARWAYSNSRGS